MRQLDALEDEMSYPDGTEEARLLQDLLTDAHARVRELESRVDWLANELLTRMLNDRRRALGSPVDVKRERRRRAVHAVESTTARTTTGLGA